MARFKVGIRAWIALVSRQLHTRGMKAKWQTIR